MSKGGRKCPYKECYLPDNNNKYWVQLVYLIISVAILIKNEKEFTFFSLLMFTAPILMDLTSTRFEGKLYNAIGNGYIILNTVIAVFCLLGMFGLFVDNGSTFSVDESAMVFAGAQMEKKTLLWPMVLDLLIPTVMYNACPSKRAKKILEKQQRKVGEK